jgi:hypothetical protein
VAPRIDAQRRIRVIGIGLVSAGFIVQYAANSMYRARLRRQELRLRTQTWLYDPGGGAAVVGELLMLAAARFNESAGDSASGKGDGGSASRALPS